MLELRGKYNSAKVFTKNIDPEAVNQIIELCSQEFVRGSKIRIMPDAHAGAGCVIGTTMTITDRVVPNLVGVDIGCGMYTLKLGKIRLDLEKLDQVINRQIPHGFDIRKKRHALASKIDLGKLRCKDFMDLNRGYLSIGTLGGGNHFIEVNRDAEGGLYLVIHSGSRNIGLQVAEYYQRLAYQKLKGKAKIPKPLAYLEGRDFQDYLHDIEIMQQYARLNRQAMAEVILKAMELEPVDTFTTIHNYIDTKNMILRKGAISAQKGEKMLIPINMRDGSVIAVGKGNPDWNYSAPHGAGRVLSRRQAMAQLDIEEFREEMKGVYTTSVGRATLDEAPMAYKPMDEILENIQDAVEVVEIIKPVYNFKAH
ncbi:MAG: RtcB family protein [Firmicutes bacterium]|nr:RtcB family protein [Bacillota bacterium]